MKPENFDRAYRLLKKKEMLIEYIGYLEKKVEIQLYDTEIKTQANLYSFNKEWNTLFLISMKNDLSVRLAVVIDQLKNL